MPDIEVTIEYINERAGNRPPSLKAGGAYYTLSDAAFTAMAQYKGQTGLLGYYTNAKGYAVASHWMGAELPKDQGRGVRAAAAAPSQPVAAPPPPPVAGRALPFGHVHLTVDGAVRTVPTVREQFIMKAVEAQLGLDSMPPVELVVTMIETAKKAWAQTMEAPQKPQNDIIDDEIPDWVTMPTTPQ